MKLTNRQRFALTWLSTRGGDACFDKNGVAFAAGDTAQTERSTWNKLEALGLIEFYGGKRDGGRGYGRLRQTVKGTLETKHHDPDRKGYSYPNLEGPKHKRPLMQDDDPAEFFA